MPPPARAVGFGRGGRARGARSGVASACARQGGVGVGETSAGGGVGRVEGQGVEKGGARLGETFEQRQSAAGRGRGTRPRGRDLARPPRVAQGQFGQVGGVEPEQGARLGVGGRDGAQAGGEAVGG